MVWPCPHARPQPALAAACRAVRNEPHPRNAHDFYTLHRALPRCPSWGPQTPPMPLCLGEDTPGRCLEGPPGEEGGGLHLRTGRASPLWLLVV